MFKKAMIWFLSLVALMFALFLMQSQAHAHVQVYPHVHPHAQVTPYDDLIAIGAWFILLAGQLTLAWHLGKKNRKPLNKNLNRRPWK